jgi:hypothetical protein
VFKTYTGACHCRAVQFEVGFDLSLGSGKCNCTYCSKLRLWLVNAKPQDFRLLTGVMDLVDYRGKNPVAHHQFCKRCGVHPFERIDMPNMSGERYYNINILCLDDIDISEFLAAPVAYYDGLNDDWANSPAEVGHL